MRSLAFLTLVVALSGCQTPEFVCSLDMECVASNGGHGRCLAQHCAFLDPSCPSGWRFDETAGAQAKACADPSLVAPGLDAPAEDAAPADAGPDSSGPDSSGPDSSGPDGPP